MIKRKYFNLLIIPLTLAGTFLSSCKNTNTKISITDEADDQLSEDVAEEVSEETSAAA